MMHAGHPLRLWRQAGMGQPSLRFEQGWDYITVTLKRGGWYVLRNTYQPAILAIRSRHAEWCRQSYWPALPALPRDTWEHPA